MPELPEVETIRRGLNQSIIDCIIKKVLVKRAKTIANISAEVFANKLKGDCFKAVKRKAKYLFFELESKRILCVHLKMSGAFLIHSHSQEIPKHTHIIFELDNGLELRFKDLRAFGRMYLYENYNELPNLNLALEPIEEGFTLQYFENNIKKYSSQIKALLLDQRKIISGLGNIYVDESLFLSGINPSRQANSLSKTEIEKLYITIKQVIEEAIKAGGSTIRDFVNANGNKGEYAKQLFVYGQKKKNCKVCNTPIQFIKLAQRGTHFCPKCQV